MRPRVSTLSAPCSPRGQPGIFHPGSALGVVPSRPSSSHGAVRPLERRAPQGLPYRNHSGWYPKGPLQGLTHRRKPGSTTRGLARLRTQFASMGFLLRGFLPVVVKGSLDDPHPLSRFLDLARYKAPIGKTAGAPGSLPRRTQSISYETNLPPCSFPPRCTSRLFGCLVKLGYLFPQRPICVAAYCILFFAPPSDIRP